VRLNDDPRLRIAAISFLNPAPLMWDFEHEPGQSRLAERYSIHLTTPSQCAEELLNGRADIGLVPVAAYAANPALRIIPGCTIASLDRVRSILLVVRAAQGVGGVQRVALDTSSRTSATYTRLLFCKYWNVGAEFVEHAPDLDAMLRIADAALLIGDPALFALEDAAAREARTGEKLEYLDLAHAWRRHTGLPWVSAFWAVNHDSLARAGASAEQVIADFQQSRDNGMAHVEDLVTEWSAKMKIPSATVRTYLTENIHYVLDEACLDGVKRFFAYAAECGVLPGPPAVQFL
jgi:chorismate dehydratase